LAIVLAATLSACGLVTGSKAPVSVDREGPFVRRFEATAPTYREGQAVMAVARMSYDGPDTVAHLSGSGSGPILFNIEQLDGDIDQSAFQHDNCRPYDLNADQPFEVPFRKSGSFDPRAADAAFWRAFFDEPRLLLPAGQYRLTAVVDLLVGVGCANPSLDLSTSLMVRVEAQ
jgi:hypothetical protein